MTEISSHTFLVAQDWSFNDVELLLTLYREVDNSNSKSTKGGKNPAFEELTRQMSATGVTVTVTQIDDKIKSLIRTLKIVNANDKTGRAKETMDHYEQVPSIIFHFNVINYLLDYLKSLFFLVSVS